MPSTRSIAMKRLPSCSSISKIVQMLGWLRSAIVSASRCNRRAASGSPTSSCERNLSATRRGRRVSSAS